MPTTFPGSGDTAVSKMTKSVLTSNLVDGIETQINSNNLLELKKRVGALEKNQAGKNNDKRLLLDGVVVASLGGHSMKRDLNKEDAFPRSLPCVAPFFLGDPSLLCIKSVWHPLLPKQP